jgi:hypothetical protein
MLGLTTLRRIHLRQLTSIDGCDPQQNRTTIIMANPYFNAEYYLLTNQDVYNAGVTLAGAEQHYQLFGAAEGRKPAPWFDAQYYVQQNPDLLALEVNQLFDHFVNFGMEEGRAPSAEAQITEAGLLAYANANEDLRTAFGIEAGATELTEAQALGLTQQFYAFGYTEDRPAAPFDADTSPGQTFTLTVNADAPGAAAPATNTLGTSGDDTYNAVDTTLQSQDSIDGAGGTDTLNVRATAAANVTPEIKNVENINVTNVSGALYTLNLVSASGVDVVASKNQAGAGSVTEFTGIAATGVTVRLDNADQTNDFNFAGAAGRTGTSDAVAVEIANGSGSATAAATFRITDGAGAAAGADATFENVNIVTSGAASFVDTTLGNASFRVINVSGTANAGAAVAGGIQGYGLSLTDTGATAVAVRTIDATDMTGTGGLNVDASASTQSTLKFTGSEVNDRVVVNGAVAAAANTMSLDGGAGAKDVLAVSANTVFTSAGAAVLMQTINAATGFEVFEATAADVTALNASNFTNIDSFVFSGAQTAGNAVTGLRTGDSVAYTVDSTFAGDVITLSGAVAGQKVNVELTGGVDITATGAGNNALTVNSGITEVTITSSNVGNLATAAAVNTITAATTVAAIDNATASTFIAKGDAGLTVGAVAGLPAPLGFTNAVTFDASALSGVLRVAGSASADVIIGGSGADIIYGGAGNDELTGNAGADQFRFLTAGDGTDVLKDFTVGTDKVGIIDAITNFAGTTGTAAGATLAATDYEASRNDITGITAGDAAKVIELQTSLTTAQITSQLGAAAANALVLVFNSTTGKGELWHDTDWSDVGTRSQLATFDTIVDLAGVQSFTNTDFVNYVV